MLAGFRSRCTTPASCAATSPAATWRAMDSALRDGQLPLAVQDRREVGAVDVRHRDVLHALDFAEVVNAHHVLVGDVPRQQQLALEALLEIARGRRVGHRLGADHLDRHDDGELFVPGLVNRTHPAHTELTDQVVTPAEWRAGLERGRRRSPRWNRIRRRVGGAGQDARPSVCVWLLRRSDGGIVTPSSGAPVRRGTWGGGGVSVVRSASAACVDTPPGFGW